VSVLNLGPRDSFAKNVRRFLLARFLVDRFASLHTLKHVKALVNELAEGSNTPKTTVDVYREMYEGTLNRIEDQAQSDRELAKKVLMWLSNAARLLTTQELCTALSIDPEDTEFDEDNLLDTELIVSVCAGLVIVEGESGIVRLVHYTAQEYFDSVGQDRRAKEQEELAKTCLTYLCFEDFKPGPHTEMRDAEAELFRMRPGWLVHYVGYGNSNGGCASYNSVRSGEVESVPLPDSDRSATFLDYAANHWFLHAKGCQVPIAHLALRLLKHQPLAAHAFHKATILHSRWAFLRNSAELASTRTTGLHLVAAAGLTQVCREFLTILDADQVNDRHIHADAKDDGGRTALMWAAHHGHYDIVELLLDRCDQMNDWPRTRINDVRHDRIDHRGDTALNYAARQGHLEVVRLLTRPDKIMAYVIMTLYWNWNHYTITEEEYLKKCIRHENAFGETAVVQAALEGHEEVVTLLRQQDTLSLHREVMFGLWPIHIAAQRRPVAVMKLLLDECGIEAYIEDPKGYSPFVVAADWNNEDIVRYFLTEKRAVLEKKPEMVVQGAKVAAANWKREAILRLILEKAGSILDQNHLEAILEVAVSAGNVSIAIYLAAQKATYESSENDAVPGGTTA
jgi:ankyrin repeat protein